MLFDVLIVIIKQGPPRAVPNMENVVIAEQLNKITPQEIGSLSVLYRSGFKMDLCWFIHMFIRVTPNTLKMYVNIVQELNIPSTGPNQLHKFKQPFIDIDLD